MTSGSDESNESGESVMAGLVTATITDVTQGWGFQLVDVVGTTILYFNVD